MIGLTGGIGAGKSTVAALLEARGAVVIDADRIARQVVEPGMAALTALAERFGADLINADGTLDRPKLAERAFASDDARKALEAITHPAIAEEFLRQVGAAPDGAVIVHDVPLLVESTRGYNYAGVIVVEAPVDTRLDRLERRGVARDDAQRRIGLQATDEQRREVATWVINNAGAESELAAQIAEIWPEVVARAQAIVPTSDNGQAPSEAQAAN